MDAAQFRADFPEFADTAKYPDSTVNLWLNLGLKTLAPDRWCDYLDVGLELFIAHNITLAANNQLAEMVGGTAGQVKGPLTSKSVDKVSAGYDTGAVALQDGGFFNLTTYGIQFLQLARMVGTGDSAVSMKITKDDVSKVLASIQDLAKKQVLVGIPASKAERQEGDEEPINNAQLGYIHEYGAPASNIPARPFLNPGIARTQESINNHLQKAAKAAMDGNSEKVDVELNATGDCPGRARNEINSGVFAALAPATLAARRKRGRTGDKPLIDTGQLRNSITYVIREKD